MVLKLHKFLKVIIIEDYRGGSAEIALEYMNAAMKLEPDDDMNYIIRSQCLIKLGRVSEAINDAEIALKSDRFEENFTS